MGCCILAAMLMSHGIVLYKRARENRWLLAGTGLCLVFAFTMLSLHWQHLGDIITQPLAFTFPPRLAEGFDAICRTVL